jgi:hypothetical protein
MAEQYVREAACPGRDLLTAAIRAVDVLVLREAMRPAAAAARVARRYHAYLAPGRFVEAMQQRHYGCK